MADNTPNGIITVKEWREHVYKKLDDHDDKFVEILQTQIDMRIAIAELKVRVGIWAGVWGLLGGLVPAVGVAIYWLASR